MCSTTTAKYHVENKSFCYKYEYVQHLHFVKGMTAESIATMLGDRVPNILLHINYTKSDVKKPTRKEYGETKSLIIDMYNNNPSWTYRRISNTLGCAYSYTLRTLKAYKEEVAANLNKSNSVVEKPSNKVSWNNNQWEQIMFSRMMLNDNVSEIRVSTDLLATIDVKVNPTNGVMTINKR